MKFKEKYDILESLGYKFAYPNDYQNFVKMIQMQFGNTQFDDDKSEQLLEELFCVDNNLSHLYYYFGTWNRYNESYLSNNCFTWSKDSFDGNGFDEFVRFCTRMGEISKGELKIENVRVDNTSEQYSTNIYFNVNNVEKVWYFTAATMYDFVYKFASLPLVFKTKGQYTVYYDGGEGFVFDWASTQAELDNFRKETSIDRNWLLGNENFV